MIIKIPFNASVSIRSLTLKAGPSGQTPREIHIVRNPRRTPVELQNSMRLISQYRDAPGMDFSDTDREATQVLEVVETLDCAEYQLKCA